ncbi:hypothetical protein G7Y89_g12430 [Cudoniella acicularis]|uniref:Uncharacterized protein n=1 Tax=Cudoniella acicularis TaxID=354080 RepID=A0A8H4VX11_9HELO|nr:hypothetical protein G7Y89_g12430 [Cudoniella acicularis]
MSSLHYSKSRRIKSIESGPGWTATLPFRLRNNTLFKMEESSRSAPPAYSAPHEPSTLNWAEESGLAAAEIKVEVQKSYELHSNAIVTDEKNNSEALDLMKSSGSLSQILKINNRQLPEISSSSDSVTLVDGPAITPPTTPDPPFQPPQDKAFSEIENGNSFSEFSILDKANRPIVAREQYRNHEGILWESARRILENYFIHPAHLTGKEFESLVCSDEIQVSGWLTENIPQLVHRAVGRWAKANQTLIKAGISPSELNEGFLDVFEWMDESEQDNFIQRYKKLDKQIFTGREGLRLTARQRGKLMSMAGSQKKNFLKAYLAGEVQENPRKKSSKQFQTFKSNIESLKRANKKKLKILEQRMQALEEIERSAQRLNSLRLSAASSRASESGDFTDLELSPIHSPHKGHSGYESETIQALLDEQTRNGRKRGSTSFSTTKIHVRTQPEKQSLSQTEICIGAITDPETPPIAGLQIEHGDRMEDVWANFEDELNEATSQSSHSSARTFVEPSTRDAMTDTCNSWDSGPHYTGHASENLGNNQWANIFATRTVIDVDGILESHGPWGQSSIKEDPTESFQVTSTNMPDTIFVRNLGVAWAPTVIFGGDQTPVEVRKMSEDSGICLDVEFSTEECATNIDPLGQFDDGDSDVLVQAILRETSISTSMSESSSTSVDIVMKNVPSSIPDVDIGIAKSIWECEAVLEDFGPPCSVHAFDPSSPFLGDEFGSSELPAEQARTRSVRKKISRFFGSLKSKGKVSEEVIF